MTTTTEQCISKFLWTRFWSLLLIISFLMTVSGTQAFSEPVGTIANQKMAIPSYFYPGSFWTQLEQGAPTVGLAIINPNSGPGTKFDQNYADEVSRAKANGIYVLGYVATDYGSTLAIFSVACKAKLLKLL